MADPVAKSAATIKVTITTPSVERYQLQHAVLIYGCGRKSYATLHDIDRALGGPVIGAGRPITQDAAAALGKSLAVHSGFTGFVAPEILYIGPTVAAWWRAPAPARVYFETQDKRPQRNLGTVSGVTPQPGLVFALAENRWFVFAVRGTERPTAATLLYRTPYFNVWETGEICEGNLHRPDTVSTESLAAFERAFFDSRFTHTNIRRGSDIARFKGGPYALWRALLAGQWKHFPEATLVPIKASLGQMMKKLEER